MYIRFVVLAVLGMLSASCAANRMEINPPTKDTSSIAPSFGKTWECPSCTPEEKYVLSEIQEKQISRIVLPLQLFLETLNKKATSVPTYAREVLEFLMTVAIAVGMESSSGLLRVVIMG